jgi:predicted signal transduction protein with EAL and GGDEF domain
MRHPSRVLAAFGAGLTLAVGGLLWAVIAGLQTFVVGALVAVILFGATLFARQHRALSRKSELFDITLRNMSGGLCMFDDMQRLVMCNERYAAMYGLTLEQMKPGTTLRAILEARVRSGNCPEDTRSYIDQRLDEVRRTDAHVVINHLRDGRVIAVNHQPLAGGGSIAVHQDITAQCEIEAKVARMARYDALTDLANRTRFMEKVGEALARLRQRQETFSILLLDLDQFKDVNDSHGRKTWWRRICDPAEGRIGSERLRDRARQ